MENEREGVEEFKNLELKCTTFSPLPGFRQFSLPRRNPFRRCLFPLDGNFDAFRNHGIVRASEKRHRLKRPSASFHSPKRREFGILPSARNVLNAAANSPTFRGSAMVRENLHICASSEKELTSSLMANNEPLNPARFFLDPSGGVSLRSAKRVFLKNMLSVISKGIPFRLGSLRDN